MFLGVALLTKSQASRLAQQHAKMMAEEQDMSVKAGEVHGDEHPDERIAAARTMVGCDAHVPVTGT